MADFDVEPWRADRELSEGGVRATLRAQFPDLSLRDLAYAGSGWDYDAYRVDGLLVRFPRLAEVAARLGREEAILSFVRASVDGAFEVPEIVLRGEANEHFPHPFFAHRFLAGVSADHPTAPESPGLAEDLARGLTRIHSIPVDAGLAIGIGVEVERCVDRYDEAVERVAVAEGIDDLAPDACDWLRRGPREPQEFRGPQRFIHNDVCPDHILVDPVSGRLAAIIDWSDAALGDPALDFVVLALWRGWDFVGDVLGRYRAPLDRAFHARLEFLARVLSLKWLADAIGREQRDVDKHVRWVANAFARADDARRTP